MSPNSVQRLAAYMERVKLCFGSDLAAEFKKDMDAAAADPAWEFDWQSNTVQAVLKRLRAEFLKDNFAGEFADPKFLTGEYVPEVTTEYIGREPQQLPFNSLPVPSIFDDEDEGN